MFWILFVMYSLRNYHVLKCICHHSNLRQHFSQFFKGISTMEYPLSFRAMHFHQLLGASGLDQQTLKWFLWFFPCQTTKSHNLVPSYRMLAWCLCSTQNNSNGEYLAHHLKPFYTGGGDRFAFKNVLGVACATCITKRSAGSSCRVNDFIFPNSVTFTH